MGKEQENGKVTTWNARRLECPEELFGPDKYILMRRLKIATQRHIRTLGTADDDLKGFEKVLEEHVIEWNLEDSWTGEKLPLPTDEPGVMGELDADQWFWIMETLQSPNRLRSPSGSSTR